MPPVHIDSAPMKRALVARGLMPAFRAALHRDGPPAFQVLQSFPTNGHPAGKTVCVLDSSFNPPTKAHMNLAIRALDHYTPTDDKTEEKPSLLLLLATANADKKAVPAATEQRLAMMCLLADELRSRNNTTDYHVDVGVTASARFIDKCADLQAYGYGDRRLVWIVGFDTLTRILDTKYYPPEHTLAPVYDTLLSGTNRILAFGRPGEAFGDAATQQAYYAALDSRVADRVDVLEADEATAGISSSAARASVARDGSVDGSVCESVAAFIQAEDLYR
ncbi:hypothetical protein Dda_8093 [Drechslerella dactyloides]|uniref:Nicotinamide-nucleotide adenylyltransferase n=1 Tax=Drechslerella dactyloides TaxID=74499 RepID=A0AAD6IUV4_DREDA|nr:hypothetical protein Dda_8093 [Drechslerella dactyloides]